MIVLSDGTRIGNYNRLSNRKKSLLTKEFCEDLRDNILNNKHKIYGDESYKSYYHHIIASSCFSDPLREVCKKYNIYKAIYCYRERIMNYYDLESFDDDILLRMVELGVIPYTTKEYELSHSQLPNGWVRCKIVYHNKGYDTIEDYSWDGDDKQSLENIYSELPNVEIIWED